MKRTFGVCVVLIAMVGLGVFIVDGHVSAADKAEDALTIVNAYVGAWNESGEDARRELLELAWSDDGVYSDPRSNVEGREALIKHTGEFANNPEMKGFTLERISGVDVHHNVLRFDWALKNADGETVIAGVDFGVLAEDGRFESITGFFGPMPEKE